MQKMNVKCETVYSDDHSKVLKFEGEHASFYMIVGSMEAVVIDTGMEEGRLVPKLREYTDLPLTLLVTHAHGDHMAHADEFENVYVSAADFPFIETAMERLGITKKYDTSTFKRLEDGQILKFGDINIEVINLPGHSAGSVVFYDKVRNLMFSGDAFGSGWSVFMQVPGSTSVSVYRDSLRRFIAYYGQLDAKPEFMTGHYEQRYMGEHDNPVCIDLIKDMEELCTRVLEGKAPRESFSCFLKTEEEQYAARYGRACMIVVDSKVRQ